MTLDFDRVYKVSGGNPEGSMEKASSLLKDFLTTGTGLVLGRSGGHWFWKIGLPQQYIPGLPSEVKVLLDQREAGNHMGIQSPKRWWVLRDRVPVKGAKTFNRTIESVRDLPYESLFSLFVEDFVVHIHLPEDEHEGIPGFKDTARKILVRSSHPEVTAQLGIWFDARSCPAGGQDGGEGQCFIGRSELQYAIRVPIYSDGLAPQMMVVPHDVVSHIRCNPDLLTRGMLIAGLPGAGKTTTMKNLLSGVLAGGRLSSLLLADVKGEYAEWARGAGVRYLTIGKNPYLLKELGINPFIPADHLRLSSHIDTLSIILAVGGAGGGVLLPSYMKIMLEEFYLSLLWDVVKKDDLGKGVPDQVLRILNLNGQELRERMGGNMACFDNVHRALVRFWRERSSIVMGRIFGKGGRSNGSAEIEDVISSRIAFFETSILQYFCYEGGHSIDGLLRESVCLSLQGFAKPVLQLVMSIFTMLSFEALLSGEETSRLSHLFVLEEAHLVAGRAVDTGDIFTVEKLIGETVERALCEGRSKGVGILLTEQEPYTRLIPAVLANTNIKICHNLLGRDGEMMGQVMGLGREADFSCLGVGEAYAKVRDDLPAYRVRIIP